MQLRSLATFTALALVAAPAAAQELARRVSAVGDGTVRVHYATRPGTCGTGDHIQFGDHVTYRGRRSEPCVEGPAYLQLEVRGGRVVDAEATVGREAWPGTSGTVTDLGRVPASHAATQLLTLAEAASGDGGEDLIFAAVLADSAELEGPLLTLARSATPATDTRRAAVFWLSHGTDAEVTGELEALAMDEDLPMDVREAAVFGLSQSDGTDAAAALKRVAQSGTSTDLREQAVFWLGQSDDPSIVAYLHDLARSSSELGEKAVFALSQHDSQEARDVLRSLATSSSVDRDVRENAIFWLSQTDDPNLVNDLSALYRDVSDADLKEKVIFAMSQVDEDAAVDWLLAVAADTDEPVAVRKQALFWAGQRPDARTRLVGLYDRVSDDDLKEQLIFVYSQMDGTEGVSALMGIARTEPDKDLRERAIFWLGQSGDPAAMDYLEALISGAEGDD